MCPAGRQVSLEDGSKQREEMNDNVSHLAPPIVAEPASNTAGAESVAACFVDVLPLY